MNKKKDTYINNVLVEDYYKFMSKRNKFYSSPLLNLVHYDFHEMYQEERDKGEKTKDIIKRWVEFRETNTGHIVWRVIKDVWGFPYVVIYYCEEVRDKYGNVMKVVEYEK